MQLGHTVLFNGQSYFTSQILKFMKYICTIPAQLKKSFS